MPFQWRYWLIWIAVFLLALLAVSLGVYLHSHTGVSHNWTLQAGLVAALIGVVVVGPPVMLAIILAAQLHEWEDWSSDEKHDLERLVEAKQQGLLQQDIRRVRDRAARTNPGLSDVERFGELILTPTPPVSEGLGRLVHLKRRGTWAPPASEPAPEAPRPKRDASTDIFRKE